MEQFYEEVYPRSVPLLLAVLIIASIGWYLFTYDRGFTRDFLLTQARYNDLHGNSRLSSWFYDLAYNFSNHDENVAIELANLYKADDNYTKAEYTLTNAINSEPSAELFTALCKTYVEQDKLLDAVSLLDKITNPDIKAKIEAQRPDAPISNYEPGYSASISTSPCTPPGSSTTPPTVNTPP